MEEYFMESLKRPVSPEFPLETFTQPNTTHEWAEAPLPGCWMCSTHGAMTHASWGYVDGLVCRRVSRILNLLRRMMNGMHAMMLDVRFRYIYVFVYGHRFGPRP